MFGVAGTAHAQQITYLAERGIGVADRPRPDYDPIGYRLDDLIVYPAVNVTTVYNDNFRATSADKRSDVYAVIRPNIRVASSWNRNAAEVTAFYERPFHAKLTQENIARFGGSGLGRYDISRETSLQLLVNGLSGVESRTSINSFIGSINPVKYDTEDLSLSATHTTGDFQIGMSGGASRRNYQDVRGTGSAIIDQDFRDVRSYFGSANLSYRVGPGLSAVISGQVDQNDYSVVPGTPGYDPLTTVDRRSKGYTIQGGLNLELSSLLFGTVQVGLLRRQYRDPRLRDFSGPSVTAQLLWNVTPLTSVRLDVARTVEDTASIDIAGNLRTRGSVAVDHELFRYVIITADAIYSHLSPNGSLPSSNELAFGISPRYLVNRHITVIGTMRHEQRTSDLSLFRFKQNTISAAVQYNF